MDEVKVKLMFVSFSSELEDCIKQFFLKIRYFASLPNIK